MPRKKPEPDKQIERCFQRQQGEPMSSTDLYPHNTHEAARPMSQADADWLAEKVKIKELPLEQFGNPEAA